MMLSKKNYLLPIMALAAGMALPSVTSDVQAMKSKEPAQIAAPASGMGQVVFYRTGGLIGAAIACNVRNEDGSLVGKLSGGKYFVQSFEPGKVTVSAKSEAKDVLNLEVEEDSTQYVRCAIGMGVMAGRPNLSPSSKEEFDKYSGKLKLKTAADLEAERAKDAK